MEWLTVEWKKLKSFCFIVSVFSCNMLFFVLFLNIRLPWLTYLRTSLSRSVHTGHFLFQYWPSIFYLDPRLKTKWWGKYSSNVSLLGSIIRYWKINLLAKISKTSGMVRGIVWISGKYLFTYGQGWAKLVWNWSFSKRKGLVFKKTLTFSKRKAMVFPKI